MSNTPDPAFEAGDVVDFTGSVSNVVTRTSIERDYTHVVISPQTIGMIIFVKRDYNLKSYWYGILIEGKVLWLSALLQGIIIRKVKIE